MVLYGLIGYPLAHSGSSMLFNEMFRTGNFHDRNYRLFPIQKPELARQLVEGHPGLSGLNVTIPFKETIIPFLDDLDPVARQIGAVNTIHVSRKSKKTMLTGYNTDAEGFIRSADFSGYTSALILGTGGAAKAIAFALNREGKEVLFVSRNHKKPGVITYRELTKSILNKYQVIINATPCGMFPETGTCPPIPYKDLNSTHFLYDLVYNPEITVFLKKGDKKGCRIQNGMEMLKRQAELSYQVWTGTY